MEAEFRAIEGPRASNCQYFSELDFRRLRALGPAIVRISVKMCQSHCKSSFRLKFQGKMDSLENGSGLQENVAWWSRETCSEGRQEGPDAVSLRAGGTIPQVISRLCEQKQCLTRGVALEATTGIPEVGEGIPSTPKSSSTLNPKKSV